MPPTGSLQLRQADPGPCRSFGAAIEITYDMLTMAHGPYESVILDSEDGHYLTSLELLMFGAWGLKTQIRVSEGAEPLELTIVLFLALPPE